MTRKKESYRLAMASSILFFAGMLLAAIGVIVSSSQTTVEGDEQHEQNEKVNLVIAVVAMSILAASVLPEILIDLRGRGMARPVARGRYGPDGWILLNCLQHTVFLAAAILQLYAFLHNDNPESFFLFPALAWTASAFLAVLSSGCCCSRSGRCIDIVNQTANGLFLGLSIAMCVASQRFSCHGCFLGPLVYGGVPFLGCGVGILYIVGDCRLVDRTTPFETTAVEATAVEATAVETTAVEATAVVLAFVEE